jgi:hypothetical protein
MFRTAVFCMKASSFVPALTIEARLKRRLREHLSHLGFSKTNEGLLAPPGDDKAAIRALHEDQRRDRIQSNKAFLKTHLSELSTYFADGSDINPLAISLRLQKIEAGTFESAVFRLATLAWSVPVSNGFGRRLRYLVWDEHNNKLAGIFAIGDPVFNLSVRDKLIGWNSQDRCKRLVNVLDAYVLGAVPPYNMLIGGKAIACLVRTREVFDDFGTKYGDMPGIISGKKKNASLLAVTTTSSLGRSSIYNRLKLEGTEYFRGIGYTQGWGHFHISDKLFSSLRDYLRALDHPYADLNRFGQGPNWRLRTIRAALKSLGFDESMLRHGIKRQVFISEFASNSLDILRTGAGPPMLDSLRSAQDVSRAAVSRWVIPRSVVRTEYKSWKRDQLLSAFSAKPRSKYRAAEHQSHDD